MSLRRDAPLDCERVDVGEVTRLGPIEQSCELAPGEFFGIERRAHDRHDRRQLGCGVDGQVDDHVVFAREQKANECVSVLRPFASPAALGYCDFELVPCGYEIGVGRMTEEVEVVGGACGEPVASSVSPPAKRKPRDAGSVMNSRATSLWKSVRPVIPWPR